MKSGLEPSYSLGTGRVPVGNPVTRVIPASYGRKSCGEWRSPVLELGPVPGMPTKLSL